MGNTNDSFKSFLYEKNKTRKKRKKRNKRKYATGGGPAIGQGGMGGDFALGGDGGAGGESFTPTDGSFLYELAMSPLAMTSSTLAHTQASTVDSEQHSRSKPKRAARHCPRCGDRLRKKDRYCPRCGETVTNVGVEQQEKEVEDQDDQQPEEQPDDQTLDLDSNDQDSQIPPEDQEPQDPDKEGIIRTVDNAHLVYKRQTPDGDYEELWIYNIDTDLRNELEIRRNILAGTDIPQGKTKSEDGSQSYDLVTLGNAQLLKIKGLQN